MINHRGGFLIYCQIFDFSENRIFEILNLESQFWVLNIKLEFSILTKFRLLLNLILLSLNRSRRELSNDTKIVKFASKIVIQSQILFVLDTASDCLMARIANGKSLKNFSTKF